MARLSFNTPDVQKTTEGIKRKATTAAVAQVATNDSYEVTCGKERYKGEIETDSPIVISCNQAHYACEFGKEQGPRLQERKAGRLNASCKKKNIKI